MAKSKREFPKIKTPELREALVNVSADYCFATEMYFGKRYNSRNLIDFWRIHPTKFFAEAFEIKVSRADFRKDTRVKQADAINNSDYFYYTAPKNMLDVEEIPDWAGLMEFDGKRFYTAKQAPKLGGFVLDHQLLINIFRRSSHFSRDNRNLHKILNEATGQNRLLVKGNEALLRENYKLRQELADLKRNTK